jgi:hypothetical protein
VRGFAQPTAACGILLACRACDQRLGGSPGVVECMGGAEEATLLVDKRLPGSACGGEGPFDTGDDLVGVDARARSPPLARAGRGAQGDLVQDRRRHAGATGRKGLRGIHCTGNGRAAQCLAGGHGFVPVRAQLFVSRAPGWRVAVLRVDAPPAWRASASGRWHPLRAIPRSQRGHRLQSGLRQRCWRVARRRGATGPPLALGLGALWEGGLALAGTVRPERGGAVGGVATGPGAHA